MNVRLEFQHKLQALEGDIIRLGSMVDEAIANAIKALEEGDLVLAQQVVRNDENINRLTWPQTLSAWPTTRPAWRG